MVALNAVEQLDSELFQLITSDTRSRGSSNGIEISFQERVGKNAHGQPCDLMVLEQGGMVARDCNRRMQLMGLLPIRPMVSPETSGAPQRPGLYD